MNAGDSCRVRWNRNPLGGFQPHQDRPEDLAPGFCLKFPRWGILRLRTNLIFPQVSRTLHRLTRHALPPERILTQPAPYISDLKGIVLRSLLIKKPALFHAPRSLPVLRNITCFQTHILSIQKRIPTGNPVQQNKKRSSRQIS